MRNFTVNGYVTYECISAIQKYIRKGMSEKAFYMAVELIDSGLGYWAFKRIRVAAYEDVGPIDYAQVTYAMQALDQCQEWFNPWNSWKFRGKKPKDIEDNEDFENHETKEPSRAWELPLLCAIVTLCNAEKTRIADHMKTAVYGRRRFGWTPEIEDWVHDKHTSKGKSMGRDTDHFLGEPTELIKGNTTDTYKEEARFYWKAVEKKNIDLKSVGPKEKRHKDLIIRPRARKVKK